MKSWKSFKISEISDLNPENIISSFPFDEIEYIDISSVGTGNFTSSPRLMSLSEAPSRAKRIIRDGDIILSTVRPNRRSFIFVKNSKENSIASTGFAVLRSNGIDSKFLYYVVSTQEFTDYLISNAKGSAYPAVDIDTIGRAEILLPNQDTQKRISSIISTYDDLIENNQKRIKILEEMAQRLYNEWFVKFNFPGHENVKMVDSGSEFGEIPEGWEVGKISNLFNFVGGYAFKSKWYSDKGKYKVITIKNIGDGEFITNNVSRINRLPENIKDEQLLKTGDVLMSLTGNIGRTCMAIGENCLLNQRVAKIKSKSHCPSYAYYFFRDPNQKMLTNKLAYGAAQQNLSTINLGKSIVICPKETIIKEFEVKTAPINQLKINLLELNECLIEQRDLLIEYLVTGKRLLKN